MLASGAGTTLQALLDAAADPAYGVEVVAVGADRPASPPWTGPRPPASRPSSARSTTAPDRDAWDARSPTRSAATEPDLVVSPASCGWSGPRSSRRFGGRIVNTHPALLPAFPGMHGARDALAYGVKVTGATLFVVDDGRRHRPDHRPAAVPVARRRRRGRRCTSASRSTSARCSSTSSAGWPARAGRSPDGRSPSRERRPPADADRAGTPRAGQRLRQDRPGGAGPRPARGRRRDRLDRVDRGAHRAPPASRSPRSRSSPASPSASTAGSRRCTRACTPGILADRAAARRTCASSTSSASSRSSWSSSNLYPFTRDRRVRRRARRVRRADRHRRPVDGARGREEPPARRGRRRPGALRRRARGRGRRRLHARRSAARLAAEAFAHTAAYDIAVASWFGQRAGARPDDGPRLPGLDRRDLERAAVLRYGENPHQRAALYRARRGRRARRRRAAARQGDELQQLRRRRRRLRAAYDFDAAAASRSSSTPTRAASRSAPTSPTAHARRTRATRCPRSAASSPPTGPSRGDGRAGRRRSSPRWSSRRPSSRTRSRSSRARRHPAAACSRPDYGTRPVECAADHRRPARADGRPDRRARRRPGDLDAGRRRRRRRRDAAPTSRSPGARCGR